MGGFSIPMSLLLVFGFFTVVPCLWAKGQKQMDLRDPFVPLITSDGKRLSLPEERSVDTGLEKLNRVTFQGIVIDDKAGSYAILNGRVVRERDEIDGMRIIRIEPNVVTILVEGKQYQIILHQLTEEAATKP